MSGKLFAVMLLLPLSASAFSQTTAPKQTESEVKLEKAAVELLRETSTEVAGLRTLENRISFNAEIASLMWFHDEKEAKLMYGSVVEDFKQLLTQFDAQMNAAEMPQDEDYASGGIFGSYGRSKVQRKFNIAMQVRKQIAMSLAEHAPDLAYNFFYDSINLITNEKFRKEAETTDRYFESELMRKIAESDPAKAAAYAKESIKRHLDNYHIELLGKLYEKDPEKAVDLGAAILSQLKSAKSDDINDYFYSSLLNFGDSNLTESKKGGGKKPPVYSRDDLREIATMFTDAILDGKITSIYSVNGYLSVIEKYAPSKAAQLRSKLPDGAAMVANTGAYSLNFNAGKRGLSTGISGPTVTGNFAANANTAVDPRLQAREAREKNEKKMMQDVLSLGQKSLPKEERERIVAESRKIIEQTPGRDKKLTSLSVLAAQVARAGDRELASEIMRDAERLVNPQPKNYQDFLLTWMLAGGYAEADPEKAFPLLRSTISRANETIAAGIKVAEFIDTNEEMMVDGELQVGMFGGSMVRELTGELGFASGTIRSLAKADFAKTRDLTNTFDRTEIRILAKMLVLRAVLDKKTK